MTGPAAYGSEGSTKAARVAMPADFAGLFNALAHPVAGVAAVSALGLGIASHGFGLWLGALAGAAEQMGRLMAAPPSEGATASRRAEATTKQLVAKARLLARELAETSTALAAERPAAPEAQSPRQSESAGALMPKDFRTPQPSARPKKPDDLKQIAGIGPKLETVLNRFGVWNFAQIAAWAPAEIAWMDEHLGFKGRIERDRWIEQAAALAGKRRK